MFVFVGIISYVYVTVISGQCVCNYDSKCLYLPIKNNTDQPVIKRENGTIVACLDSMPKLVDDSLWDIKNEPDLCNYSPHATYDSLMLQVDSVRCKITDGVDIPKPPYNPKSFDWVIKVNEQFSCMSECNKWSNDVNITRISSFNPGVIFNDSNFLYAEPKIFYAESTMYGCVHHCDIAAFCSAITYDGTRCSLYNFKSNYIDSGTPKPGTSMVILTNRLNGHLMFHNTKISGDDPYIGLYSRTDMECEDMCLNTTQCVASQFGWGECKLFQYPNRFSLITAAGYTVFVDKRDNTRKLGDNRKPVYYRTKTCLKVLRAPIKGAFDCVTGKEFTTTVFGLPRSQIGEPVLTTVSGKPGVCSSEKEMVVYPTLNYEIIEDCVTIRPLFECYEDEWNYIKKEKEKCNVTITDVRYTNLASNYNKSHAAYVNPEMYTCGFSCSDHQGTIVRKGNGGWACVVINDYHDIHEAAYFTDDVTYRSAINAIFDLSSRSHIVKYHNLWTKNVCTKCVNPPCEGTKSKHVYEIKYFNINLKNTGGFTIYNQQSDDCFLYDGKPKIVPKMRNGVILGTNFLRESYKRCISYKLELLQEGNLMRRNRLMYIMSSAESNKMVFSNIWILLLAVPRITATE